MTLNWKIDLNLGPALQLHLDELKAKKAAEEKKKRLAAIRKRSPATRKKISRTKTGKLRKPFTKEHKAHIKTGQRLRRQKEKEMAALAKASQEQALDNANTP